MAILQSIMTSNVTLKLAQAFLYVTGQTIWVICICVQAKFKKKLLNAQKLQMLNEVQRGTNLTTKSQCAAISTSKQTVVFY